MCIYVHNDIILIKSINTFNTEERRMGQQQVQGKKRKSLPLGFWIAIAFAIVLIVALAIAAAWILTHQGITQGTATLTIVSIIGGLILALIAALFTYLQWRYPVSSNTTESAPASPTLPAPSPTPIIIQLQQPTSPQPLPPPILQPPVPEKPVTGNVTGSFPPTDPKTIQQRRKLVEEVYASRTVPSLAPHATGVSRCPELRQPLCL